MTLNGRTTLNCTNDVRLSDITTPVFKKIDPYYQGGNVARRLLSGGIRFVRIFVGIPWRLAIEWASNDSGVVRTSDF